MATTVEEPLAQLEALADEKVRAHNSKYGAGDNQFGVKLGDIRKPRYVSLAPEGDLRPEGNE